MISGISRTSEASGIRRLPAQAASPAASSAAFSVIWLTVLCFCAPALAAAQILHVSTWPEYIDPEVASEFEPSRNVTVRFTCFDSDETRDNNLAASAGRGYDVLMVNRLQLPSYVRCGWLEPLTEKDVPNRRDVEERWSDSLNDATHYAVAYFWGTMGIAYRHDLVPEGFRSWMELLQTTAVLSQRILMPNSRRELVALALKAQKQSANASDPLLIDAAGRLLLAQAPHVRYYGYPALDENSELITGAIRAAAMYNSDLLMPGEYSDAIRFVIPEEGALPWVDYLTVAQSSTSKTLAFDFIDNLNDPDIAARQAEYVYYASPRSAARERLTPELLSHALIYSSIDVLNRSGFLEALPPRSQKRIDVIGSQPYH